MTHIEEKFYLQSVFNAIDEVYKLNNPSKALTYEERLRASFNKLLIPDWYNNDYTSINELRKTKSHGQVSRTKRYDNKPCNVSSNNSSCFSNGTIHRHQSPTHSWSEMSSLRRSSTTANYDTNVGVTINGRCLTNSHDTATYVSGLQRVIQSSSWYKPKTFTRKTTNKLNNDLRIEQPKPLPRYSKVSGK